jgi:hypothetical protein
LSIETARGRLPISAAHATARTRTHREKFSICIKADPRTSRNSDCRIGSRLR